ncbi:MAG: glycoside hydrolase family 2 TIM barrel-domain containing protein [Anaerolineae bacterium]
MQSSLSLNGGDWQLKGYFETAWRARGAHRPNRDPHGWMEAAVPGSVHDDLLRAGEIPDPYVSRNSLLVEWVADRTWVYRKSFTLAEERMSTRAQLIFEGIDYQANIYLNGELLGMHRGMFSPAKFDVADRLIYGGENEIAVVIPPAPHPSDAAHKPYLNEGEDGTPRLIHIGLWDDVHIEFTDAARLDEVFLRPQLSADHTTADITVTLAVDAVEAVSVQVVITFLSDVDVAAYERVRFNLTPGTQTLEIALTLDQPRLWMPNGSGEPLLYSADVALLQPDPVMPDMPTYLDGRTFKLGLRSLEWKTAHEDEPGSLIVNGQPVRLHGWAWQPLDLLYGVPRPEKLRHLFELLHGANVNLVRVASNGLIEREDFYQLADEYGIMVWQEFALAGLRAANGSDLAPDFHALMMRESEAVVRRKRNHASLVLWGGCELGVPADHPWLAAMGEVIRRLDPDRRWLPTVKPMSASAYTLPPFLQSDAKSTAHRRLLKWTIDSRQILPADPDNRQWEHRGAQLGSVGGVGRCFRENRRAGYAGSAPRR